MTQVPEITMTWEASDPQERITQFRLQVAAAPDDGEAHLHLGAWLHTAGQRIEAMEQYQQSVRLLDTEDNIQNDPGKVRLSGMAYYWLGCAFSEESDYARAKTSWEQGLASYKSVIRDETQLENMPQVARIREKLKQLSSAG